MVWFLTLLSIASNMVLVTEKPWFFVSVTVSIKIPMKVSHDDVCS